MSADGDGKNPSFRDSIVVGRPMESAIAPATMPRTSSVRAPIHRMNEDRQRDERDGGRYA